MAIEYVGLSSGAQVTRGYWRVILGAGFSLSDLASGPFSDFSPWPVKVDAWRAKVPTILPAICFPAAVAGGGPPVPETARAVVDVQILGAELGQSVSQIVEAMDRAESRIDVLRVVNISLEGPSAEGRSKALQDTVAQAERETFADRIMRFLQKSALILGAIAAAGVVLYFYLTRRR